MLKQIAVASSLALAAVAAPAAAAEFVYYGSFSGANENPSNASPATGKARVIYDDSAQTLRVIAKFSGLIGNTAAAHIHEAASFGANGGVMTQTPSFAGFPIGVTSGFFDQTYDLTLTTSYRGNTSPMGFVAANGGSAASAETALAAKLASGNSYFNIHTGQFPGGEIRANLVAVPEPGTWALMIGGMGLVGGALRARRRTVAA